MSRLLSLFLCVLCLSSCASWSHRPTLAQTSQLLQGKREFENGYYLDAMHRLLPLACDGDAQAQYAVGYMFYYGYGVGQDTTIGCFWIQRAASQGFPPAIAALQMAGMNHANTAAAFNSQDLTLSAQMQAQTLAKVQP